MKKLNYLLLVFSASCFIFGMFSILAGYENYTNRLYWDRLLLGVSLIIGSSIITAGSLIGNAVLIAAKTDSDLPRLDKSKGLFRED